MWRRVTSLVVARETGAHVIADDLWVSEADNAARFQEWGVRDRVTPVRADANKLPFEQGRFSAIISIDAYHYFAGREGFFQQKLLPLLKEGGMALIGIPGLKDAYEGRAEVLLSGWLGEEAHLFKSPGRWRRLIGAKEEDHLGRYLGDGLLRAGMGRLAVGGSSVRQG